MSSVTPLDTMFIPSYSDAKNSLAGIFDQNDSITKVRSYFIKTLIWLLLKQNSKSTFKKIVSVEETNVQDQSAVNMINMHGMTNTKSDDNTLRTHSTLSNALTIRSNSLDSFMSILSTDNESSDKNKRKNKTLMKQTVQTIDSSNFISSSGNDDYWDVNSVFSDSGFGLPAVDLNTTKKKGTHIK